MSRFFRSKTFFCAKTRRTAVLIACVLGFFGSSVAQTTSGIITGSVVDSSSLPVSDATVTLKNEQTNERRTTQSNADGTFTFAAVLPGRYTIAVELAGFKRLEKSNLNITASERLPAGQFALEV